MSNKSSPVILKLEGGLGNQLFQFAAGYCVASKLNVDLHIDQYSIPLTTVHGETGIGFEPFEFPSLQNENRVYVSPTLPARSMLYMARRNAFFKRLAIKKRLFTSNRQNLELFLESNDLDSTEDIFDIYKPQKLHGNFQSWKIVEKAAQFGFPRILHLRNVPQWISDFEKVIDFKNSVVLHFRVGDDTLMNSNFKQPEINYYLEALKVINTEINFTKRYILSDDVSRVKEMFGDKFDENFYYLDMPEDSTAAERLYVLSLFGGIICANSTFCGWAAWSIYNSGGQVVVPVPYSDGPVLGSRDFPSSWHKLDKVSGEIVA